MRRIIILMLFLFLSGCTVNYNIELVDDTIKEDFLLNVKTNEMCGSDLCTNYINNFANNDISVNYNSDVINQEYIYKKNILNDNNNYSLQLNYDYNDTSHYNVSFLANNLFKNVIITKEKIMAYDVKDVFINYLYLDKIVIGIKTDKVVSSSNCDEIKGDVYYWYLERDNYKDKSINVYFDLYDLQKQNQKIVEDGYLTDKILKYILLVLGIIVVIGSIYILIKIKKSSR